jgi:tetratricopeptide (TPR) repeat protein
MVRCRDKRFRDMLYAYELGMLSEDERRELELHLLECEECMQSVIEFKRVVQYLRHNQEVRDNIREIIQAHDNKDGLQPARKSIWAKLIPSVAAVAVVIILLILQPWEIEIRSKQARAAYDILAVMYFENMIDEQDTARLGEIITDLLITDLSESQYIQVVSGQRLYDILKNMGREGQKNITKDIATQIARRTDAKWMLRGKILQLEPEIILTSELVDIKSGLALATQRIKSFKDESLFSLVDKLTIEIKSDLSLPAMARTEKDLPIENITTNSIEAYRYYLEGFDYFMKYYWKEAEEKFKKALEYDSTFALAYLRMAMLKFSRGTYETKPWIDKAMRYVNNAPLRVQLAIKSMNAITSGKYLEGIAYMQELAELNPYSKEVQLWLGYFSYLLHNYDKAIEYFNTAIELDSLFWNAYEMMGRVYAVSGDYEKAIWTLDKYISLAPNFALSHYGKGNIYLNYDKIDQALESYNKALEILPDFFATQEKLGLCYLYKKDFGKAEYYFRQFAKDDELTNQSQARTYLAVIPLYQGRFERALEVLDSAIAIDEQMYSETGFEGDLIWKYFSKIRIYIELGLFDQAESEIEKTLELIKKGENVYSFLNDLMCMLAFYETGKGEKAELYAAELQERFEERKIWPDLSRFITGIAQYSHGNYEDAFENLKALDEYYGSFETAYILGRCALETNRLEEAVEAFENRPIISGSSRFHWGIWAVKSYYYLGLAYEKSNWIGKAIEMYEEFLDIWKSADPGRPEIENAQNRLRHLKNRT